MGALLWVLCHIRNKLTIKGIFPSHPANVIFKYNPLFHRWSPLRRRKDTEMLQHAQNRFKHVYVLAKEPAAAAWGGWFLLFSTSMCAYVQPSDHVMLIAFWL